MEKGLALLDELAAADDRTALYALGDLYSRGGPVRLDATKAIDYLTRAVAAGNTPGNVRLGEIYRDGIGVPADADKAIRYFQAASEEGNYVKVLLAETLMKSPQKADVDRGLGILEEVAATGDRHALHALGLLYSRGGAVEADVPRAIDYFARAGAAGNTSSFIRLGEIYRDGTGVPADPAKAVSYFEAAAIGGNTYGKVLLGDYLVRSGSSGNIGQGLSVLQQVAEQGDENALFALGDLYSRGGPVPIDGPRAIDYLTRAAVAGNETASLRLGEIYRDGVGVPSDLAKAIANFQVAADQGSAYAKVQLAQTLVRMDVASDVSRGLDLLKAMADENDHRALYALGTLYLGDGPVTKDSDLAVDYLERAAAAGHPGASVKLGEIYRDGDGVPADAKAAAEHFRAATSGGSAYGKILLGETLVKSGEPASVDQGLKLVEEVAAGGDGDALFMLGDLYSRGGPVAVDGEKAVGYFTRAVTAGSVAANVRLGEIYRDGVGVPADQAKAKAYFKAAADAGFGYGAVQLGQAMVRQGSPEDVEAGLALLRAEIAKNNMSAVMALADLLGRGEFVPEDGAEAIRLWRQAGEAGNGAAYYRIGELYIRGLVVGHDPRRALAAFRKSAELGDIYGTVALAENHVYGYFGKASRPAAGLRMLKEAQARGIAEATPVLADLYLSGTFVPRSPAQALAMLEKEAATGSNPAIRKLIGLYRDGRSEGVRRSPARAARYLDLYGPRLDPAALEVERILLAAAEADDRAEFDAVSTALGEVSPAARSEALPALRWVNERAFVYVVQKRLQTLGLYNGRVNGMLTHQTIRSMLSLCDRGPAGERCRRGPLTGPAVRLLAVRVAGVV